MSCRNFLWPCIKGCTIIWVWKYFTASVDGSSINKWYAEYTVCMLDCQSVGGLMNTHFTSLTHHHSGLRWNAETQVCTLHAHRGDKLFYEYLFFLVCITSGYIVSKVICNCIRILLPSQPWCVWVLTVLFRFLPLYTFNPIWEANIVLSTPQHLLDNFSC